MAKAVLILATVLERLAEREMDVQRIVFVEPSAECFTHLRDVAIRELERLEVGERPISVAMGGISPDCPLQRLEGFARSPDRLEGIPKPDPQASHVRLLTRHLLVQADLPL